MLNDLFSQGTESGAFRTLSFVPPMLTACTDFDTRESFLVRGREHTNQDPVLTYVRNDPVCKALRTELISADYNRDPSYRFGLMYGP